MCTFQSCGKKKHLPSSSPKDNLLPLNPLEENLPSDLLKDRPVCLDPILEASDTWKHQNQA